MHYVRSSLRGVASIYALFAVLALGAAALVWLGETGREMSRIDTVDSPLYHATLVNALAEMPRENCSVDGATSTHSTGKRPTVSGGGGNSTTAPMCGSPTYRDCPKPTVSGCPATTSPRCGK